MAFKEMIPKTVRADSWDSNGSTASRLLEISSKGLEKAQVQKTGADSRFLAFDISPEPGFSFVHVITTGAGEYYGMNNNGDFFNEGPCTVSFPEPCMQKTAELSGGLRQFHSTYSKLGGVYRQHRNGTKGFQPEGEVFAETYNEPAHRGELILKLANDKWRDTLQKIAEGKPVFWSIGAGVPEDICTVCGFRYSKKKPRRCEHTQKEAVLSVFKGGVQAGMYNDRPHFHDISEVRVPAARIAFALQKVAGGDPIEEERQARLWLPYTAVAQGRDPTLTSRKAWLKKLAAEEKEVEKEDSEKLKGLKTSADLSEDELNEIQKKLEGIPLDALVTALAKFNMMLTPDAFMRIVSTDESSNAGCLPGLKQALRTVFTDTLDRGDADDFLADCSYLPGLTVPCSSESGKVLSLESLLGLNPEPVQKRIVRIVIRGPKVEKTAAEEGSEPSPAASYLAREYARYQLAFVAHRNSPESALMAVMANR